MVRNPSKEAFNKALQILIEDVDASALKQRYVAPSYSKDFSDN